MDITTDGFGYMLAFGDLAWVPFTYSLQARPYTPTPTPDPPCPLTTNPNPKPVLARVLPALPNATVGLQPPLHRVAAAARMVAGAPPGRL
eukprot:scaffold71517_cov55-Phaeocystis_antarctica.AAC.5